MDFRILVMFLIKSIFSYQLCHFKWGRHARGAPYNRVRGGNFLHKTPHLKALGGVGVGAGVILYPALAPRNFSDIFLSENQQ